MVSSPEDYYVGFPYGTIIRMVRYLALGTSLFLPAVYIAITTFHQEMLPTELILSIASAREGVPFPSIVELLIMEFLFEALREAGIRLPRPFGQAVSIVGALIIGQAAVQASLVSPLLIIVVAVTGIASFISPIFSMGLAMRFLRFPITLLGATLGLFGVAVGVLAILIHLAGLRSFGVPFMSPVVPANLTDWKDTFVRWGMWTMEKRPSQLFKSGRRRMARGLKPEPPQERFRQGGER
ncbi:MAG: spore germination protein, partial [Eubacteriales bacterium]|nr:spore germination protein [Eubacteriales bacterium]